jgi:hypothetical protein
MTAVAECVAITEPGIYPDLSEASYHADPVPGGSLSSTGARKLLPPSCPARFRYERDHPAAPSEQMELGTAAHRLILGVGAEIAVIPAENWRTNAAKAEADEARAEGRVPLLTADYAKVRAMAEALRANDLARFLLSRERGGYPEQSLFGTDPETGVWCRVRLDWMPDENSQRPIIADYKTAESCHPEAFARSAARYGYHVQEVFYRRLYAQLTGRAADFLFVVQEKQPPYLVNVCQLGDPSVAAGETLVRRALERYRDCTESGLWPGYDADTEDGIAHIDLPRWAMPGADW